MADACRGRGLGAAVMRLLLDHTAVRRTRAVRLETLNADGFCEPLGFRAVSRDGGRLWMVRAGRS